MESQGFSQYSVQLSSWVLHLVAQDSKIEEQEIEATCYLKTGPRNWHNITSLYSLGETVTETAQIQKHRPSIY